MLGNSTNDFSQLQLPPLQHDEFLPRIGKWIMGGGLLLIVVFGAAVVASTVLRYKVAVKAPATIRPAGELRLVQPAIAGTITQIHAQANQHLQKGAVIAHIDNSRLLIQESQLQESIQQIQLQLGQIDAQISSLESQLVAESALIDRSLAATYAELASNLRQYQDQSVISQANLNEAEVNLSVAIAQQNRLQEENELEATLQEARAELQFTKAQRDRLNQVLEYGAISQNYYEEKAQAYERAKAKLAQTQAAAKKIAEEKLQAVQAATASLQRARAAVNPSDANIVMVEERVGLERAKGRATIAALNKEKEMLVERQIGLQNQLDQALKDLQQVETDLEQTVIRSPVEGILIQLQLRNQGQVVQPGEAIARIAPTRSPLLIKTQIPAQDIDKVKLGQIVQMQISACPHPDYGTLKGTVKTVAPDTFPASRREDGAPTGPATYEVVVQPQAQFVGNQRHQCPLQAGMEGRANIISREETILKFILRKTRLLTEL